MRKLRKYVLCFMMIALVSSGCSSKDKEEPKKDKNETGVKVDESVVSWANMKIDNPDLKLTEDQKEVIKYFDTDYFQVGKYENLQRYPKIFDNSQITFNGEIIKTIKTTDDEYEFLMKMDMTSTDSNEIVIKGKQQEPRLIEGDMIQVYGRYQGVDQYEIDGKSHSVPTVKVNKTAKYWYATNSVGEQYTFDTLNTVAKAVFGKNIKMKEAICNEDYELGKMYSPQEHYFLITPDNQSNADFKEFEITSSYSMIRAAKPTGNSQKQIHVSADFKHYIATTYEESTKMLYMDYYDTNFKKVWGREFKNVDEVPYDYTSKLIYLVADNYLSIIDTKTGEDIQKPVMVGEKTKVQMTEDGAILIGTGNKDNIMKVDKKGEIVWTSSADVEVTDCYQMQMVNGNIIVELASNIYAEGTNVIDDQVRKMVLIDKNGNIIQEFISNEYHANTNQDISQSDNYVDNCDPFDERSECYGANVHADGGV